MTTRRLWIILGLVLLGTFFTLGWFGREVYRQSPPIPERVVTPGGRVLFTRDRIQEGQRAWQSMGGQQVGSIWGHGPYQAPDWTADWLHREAVALLDAYAAERGRVRFSELTPVEQGGLRERLRREMRQNRYDPASGTLTVSEQRAAAIAATASHYEALFGDGPALRDLRSSYAIAEGAVPDPERRIAMAAFFFWTAWAATTERPGSAVTYTNNWPHEPLVGNHPTSANLMWSIISVVLLLAGIGAMVWFKARRDQQHRPATPPLTDPLAALTVTPSMRAVWKLAAVVIGLFLLQVLTGIVTAHYTVEGQGFFGIPLATVLPYAVTRTWHIQLGVFWIATAFLAAGLFLAPAVGGREPRLQRAGVNVLFAALVVVVLGSLAGEWMAVKQRLSLDQSFWFGHQGYEYVDLGRIWQVALLVGLGLWMVLMLRGMWRPQRRGGNAAPAPPTP
jgi:nitric oxide reductase subunit B